MPQNTINIGILAHVDAGKTTITEQILFQSGALRNMGSVDKGTSVTDHLAVEKERGISVRLATASFTYKDTHINIIDTPGHVDFCAEVEYSLRALDAVVLVVSAVEGVQGHTLSLFQAIKQLVIPCIIFINKIDRVGADVAAVMLDIETSLSKNCILLQGTLDEASGQAQIKSKWNSQLFNSSLCEKTLEKIVELDEALMDSYLNGENLDFSRVDAVLMQNTAIFQLIPVLLGVAKNGVGILELLDAIVAYLPKANGYRNKPLSAVVFKIEHDITLGKMVYLRVFEGQIKSKDVLHNATRAKNKTQKAGQLKSIFKGKYLDIDKISADQIGIVSGLSEAKVGDIYGNDGSIPELFSLSTPMLTVQVTPNNPSEIMNLVQALDQLCDEDPLLAMQWLSDLRELHINITGMIQVEILEAVLLDRYGLIVNFSAPTIIYKETPKKCAFGYERYWMPKPCWAIVKFKIEPAELGSGVSYYSQVGVNDVAIKYQKEVELNIDKSLQQGIKGWQVTDCKITLVEAEDHNVHSRSGDFAIATPLAIMNGLVESDTTLLEPILSFYLSASMDLLGAITSDITKMRGTFENPEINNEIFVLKGKVPAATAMKYPIELASLSAGKAKISTQLCSYEACTDEQGKTTDYRGVSPLNRDKWILQARGAL